MKQSLLGFGLSMCLVTAVIAADPAKVSKSGKPKLPAKSGYYPPNEDAPLGYPATRGSELPVAVNPGAIELSRVPLTGRKKWEALLSEPAGLDFGDRQSVTVREILDGLRKTHHLSLRLDIPTLAALIGTEHLVAEPKSVKATKHHGPYAASQNRRSPIVLTGGESSKQQPVIVESTHEDAEAVLDKDEAPGVAVVEPVETEPVDTEAEDVPGTVAVTNECDADDDQRGKAKVGHDEAEDDSEPKFVEKFLSLEVDLQTIDLMQASVATVLRQTFDAMPIVFGSDVVEMPFPISLTNACLLDYIVENDGLVITTRMQALSFKETRVYSIKHLKDVNADQLAKIIRQSVRPWSWRSQINDLGDQLRGSIQLPPEMVKSIVTTGVQLAAAQTGATVTVAEDPTAELPAKSSKSETEQLNAIGNATVNGLVTFAHATLLSLEMVHHAEFPTGTIVSLPGKLIVTQSQAAHREIADLIKQLADE